jgi:cytosine deaminase
MTMDFMSLPDAEAIRLENLTLPGYLAGARADLVRGSLTIAGGRIAADRPDAVAVDMRGAIAFPCFTDAHTHLDKGHIWPRSANPDGTFLGALTAAGADHAHWSAADLRPRMEFALRCAFAHGTRAIRTHLDSGDGQERITFPVFEELRAAWAGRIDLQAACLVGCEIVVPDSPFDATADLVARHGGILGMATYRLPGVADQIARFFRMAADRGLAADLHVDETLDPEANTLRLIAERVIADRFDAPVQVGHCCSLSAMPEAEALRTLDRVAEAGIAMVSLPMCNLYLQDRQAGRTPRRRGITLVHEAKARGIPVSFASDNTRDPFYAYGDLDMLEVLREATRIGHLDHSDADWAAAVNLVPARSCGFDAPSLAPGAPADLVIFRARNWTELLARPQADRIVLRQGRAIDRRLPDYSELDHLMEAR